MSAKHPTAVIVAGDFHQDMAATMIAEATAELKAQQVSLSDTVTIAGCYEVPLIVQNILAMKKPDLVIVLGFIEKGETLHGEVMGHVVNAALIDLQLKFNTPIGIGLIGPGATPEQARVRMSGAARGAVKAAVRSLMTVRYLKK